MLRKIFLLLVLMPLLLSGQGFDAGFNGGFTVNQVDGDNYSGYNKPGLAAGVFVRRDLSVTLSAFMELNYTEKGAAKKTDENDTDIYKLRLRYATIPLYLRYNYDRIGFNGGLVPGYLFQAQTDIGQGYQDPPEDFNQVEVAGMLGLSYDLTPKWSIQGRFLYSLNPIFDRAYITRGLLDEGQYNNSLQLKIYYQF